MKLEDFRCDCGATGANHEDDCMLQDLGVFTLGMVRWNGSSLEADPLFDPDTLRPVSSRRFRTGEDINTDNHHDWDMLHHIDNTIDWWIEHEQGELFPMNFSAQGLTWVWNPEHARWDGMPLGCYCGQEPTTEGKYQYCFRCEVVRTSPDDAWGQGMILPNEATCQCQPPARYTCVRCNVRRLRENEPWEVLKFAGSVPAVHTTVLPPPCDHRLAVVDIGDGTKMYASRFHRRDACDDRPAWGVYLDKAWADGDVIGTMVPWADFALPKVPIGAIHKLCIEMVERARNEVIEVSCLGGHGRTGTFLACCAVVVGLPAEDAIAQIRKSYCSKAVETPRQEWYVGAMHSLHHKLPIADIPPDDLKGGVSYNQPRLLGETEY